MLETITAPSRQAARWRESGVPPASLTALIKIAVNLPKESTVQQLRTQSSRHVWLPYVAVFVLALGLRLTYEAFVWNGPLGNADSAAYEDLAVKILRHQPYQTDQSAGPGGFPSDLQRPPGYPVFLAAVNIHAATTNAMSKHRSSLAQCILGAAFATVLAWLAATLTSPWIGILAGCFYAADWVTIVHTPMVLSETVFAVVLGSAVLIYALALPESSLAVPDGWCIPWPGGAGEAGRTSRRGSVSDRMGVPQAFAFVGSTVSGDVPGVRVAVDGPQ